MAADIAEWLKDHQYTCLADANGVEVWRCQKPGTVHLAFDICITRFGISMFGDIDSLVFRVGASYGLGFLARKPDGYMIEKLDSRYRAEREFDQPGFLDRIVEAVCDLLSLSLEDLPEWISEEGQRAGKFDELSQWIDDAIESGRDSGGIDFDDIQSFLVEVSRVEDARDGHELLAENEELLDISDTWEWDLTEPSVSLVRRLHYVSHAARAILAQKEAQAGQQVAP